MWNSIYQDVDVMAVFSRSSTRPDPKVIIWNDRRMDIAECLEVRSSGAGGLRYCVRAGDELAMLSFDHRGQAWSLIATDGSADFHRRPLRDTTWVAGAASRISVG